MARTSIASEVQGPSAGNNYSLQISTAAVVKAVPAAWSGSRVYVKAFGNVWLNFGTSASVSVTATAFDNNTASAFAATTVGGFKLAVGDDDDFVVDPSWTHFAVIADAASTDIYFRKSSK